MMLPLVIVISCYSGKDRAATGTTCSCARFPREGQPLQTSMQMLVQLCMIMVSHMVQMLHCQSWEHAADMMATWNGTCTDMLAVSCQQPLSLGLWMFHITHNMSRAQG